MASTELQRGMRFTAVVEWMCCKRVQRGLPNARLHMPSPSCANNDFEELFTGSILLRCRPNESAQWSMSLRRCYERSCAKEEKARMRSNRFVAYLRCGVFAWVLVFQLCKIIPLHACEHFALLKNKNDQYLTNLSSNYSKCHSFSVFLSSASVRAQRERG